MRTIMTLTAVLAVGLAVPTSDQDGWVSFKAQFGKVYPDLREDSMRKELFMNSKAKVEKHNALFTSGLKSFEMALNHMSDWSDEEIRGRSKGVLMPESRKEPIFHEPSGDEIPASVDWRKKNAVTPVKNQLSCGACYAFYNFYKFHISAVPALADTGSLEGQIAIKNKKLVSLSEQEILDCPFEGTNKCDGGYPSSIFDDLGKYGPSKDPKGLETEENYPYTGVPQKCSYNKSDSASTAVGHKQVPANEEALKEAVANVGPISVVIYTNRDFDFYNQGIFDSTDCYDTQHRHAILVVGYDKDEAGNEYWIVKNSWGSRWGEDGYIRMAIGSNLCGIANEATYPLL